MAKQYKIFVSYSYTDKMGVSGFGSCVVSSTIYPLTVNKVLEIQNFIKTENEYLYLVALNFIKLAD